MDIAGYIKTSVIEWPGKITSVIFVPGCNFRCPFCHNPFLVKRTLNLTLIPEEEIFADLEKRKKWVEAVAVTGGEPTLQPDLFSFLAELKKRNFLVMLETNGSRPEVVEKLGESNLVDFWAMDLKGDFDDYQRFVGIKDSQIAEKVKKSFNLILKSKKDFEFRTTVVPSLHNKENLEKLARQISLMLGTEKIRQRAKWYLQQFRPQNTLDPEFLKIAPFTEQEMKSLQERLKRIVPQTLLRVYN